MFYTINDLMEIALMLILYIAIGCIGILLCYFTFITIYDDISDRWERYKLSKEQNK